MHVRKKCKLCIYLAIILFSNIALCVVYVDTKLGKVKGFQMISRNGRKFNAFLGIPYAKPPIGDLRFHDPVPITSWNDTLDATKYPPYCSQIITHYIGEEDCLYLNLYTPKLLDEVPYKLPVLYWIHPGRRLFGDSQPYHYGPQYFMDKSVIIVTSNYRLGVLGYFNTEDSSSTGNYGLKDQTAVLRWIHSNIVDYNGDPTNVTIFGHSSGAIDVSLHLTSPLSKGLFQKAISQSGHPFRHEAIRPKGSSIKGAYTLARILGCADFRLSEHLVDCLRKVPVDVLTKSTYKIKDGYFSPHISFGPVIEPKSTGTAFIIGYPVAEIEKSRTPWLFGMTTDEGSPMTLGVYSKKSTWQHMMSNYEKSLPQLFGYNHLTNANHVTEVLLRQYVHDVPLVEAFEGISKIFGFGTIQSGLIEAARRYKGPKYFYIYDHLHKLPYIRLYEIVFRMHTKIKTGVVHGEEILSLFYLPYLYPPVLEAEDRFISDTITDFWSNFAQYGDPNGDGRRKIWNPVCTSEIEYLYVNGTTIEMRTNPMWEEYRLWKDLGNPTLFLQSPEIL